MTKNATKDFGLSKDDYLRSSLLRFRNGQQCKMKTLRAFTFIGEKSYYTIYDEYRTQAYFCFMFGFHSKKP